MVINIIRARARAKLRVGVGARLRVALGLGSGGKPQSEIASRTSRSPHGVTSVKP